MDIENAVKSAVTPELAQAFAKGKEQIKNAREAINALKRGGFPIADVEKMLDSVEEAQKSIDRMLERRGGI